MSKGNRDDIANHIAIIGMAGRFPGARNLDEFWSNLADGVESIRFFSDEELLEAGADPDLIGRDNYVKAKGYLEDAEYFDAGFFGYIPREADILDPQQRVFLECAWETFEAAGYDPDAIDGPVGVFAGVSLNSYAFSNLLQNATLVEQMGAYQLMLGNDKDFLPTRVSYKLNLKGPSVLIQTACSTSLVAVQFACQSLLDFQSDMALAGGISITFPRKAGYLYQEGMILSPDGHCRAFDAGALGTLGGEGVGIVLLKRLEDALEDGDNIRAVILGGAVNNDGSGKIGYTAPSVDGQSEVISMAHAVADVGPDSISYVETHGTGTNLGDPIEIAGLTQAFRLETDRTGYCAIGSLKTNVGHLDAAAGVASLIKTVLALEHRQIPPSLHFESPNPEIDFDTSPFFVNTTLTDWESGATPRRAGVSSFGIGGTNVHVVVEESPRPADEPAAPGHCLVPLSAMTEDALQSATTNLADHLGRHRDLPLADIAYTLQAGRRHFAQRRFVVGSSIDEVIERLDAADAKRAATGRTESDAGKVAFLFTGQGSQYVNMARALYEEYDVFREQLDTCAEHLRAHLDLDIREVLYPAADLTAEADDRINQTGLAQPTLFAIEYSMAKLWMDWGVQPSALLGHSVGEYVAACIAGVYSLQDGLRLIAERGRLMQAQPSGTMLAVPMGEDELEPLLGDELSLAAVNAPGFCVVSGPEHAAADFERALAERGVEGQRLKTSHAFHSSMMDPIIDSFTAAVAETELHAPSLPVLSNVTGTWMRDDDAMDPAYWSRHLRQTVRFADGAAELTGDGDTVLLEVGPGNTLASLARQQPGASARRIISCLRHPRDDSPDGEVLMQALGQLWLAGVPLDWQRVHGGRARRRVPLPSYPFQRERHVIDAQADRATPAMRSTGDLDKKSDLGDWFYVPSWRRTAPLPDPGTIEDDPGWLVFVDDEGYGEALVESLRGLGQTVTAVRAGTEYLHSDEHGFEIDPGALDDYGRLIDELARSNDSPGRIVHLWNVSGASGTPDAPRLRDLGFFSLVYIIRTWVDRRGDEPLRIDVVSNGTQNVDGTEEIAADKATILGPGIVIRQEYPQIACRNYDIGPISPDDYPIPSTVSRIVAEMMANPVERSVAIRRDQRWVFDVDPVYIDSAGHDAAIAMPALRRGGVYLVTGGLGTIGLSIASFLAESLGARLVLTGRTQLPPREAWDAFLDDDDCDAGTRAKIAAVQHLEAQGAEVLVHSADVADETAMGAVFDAIDDRFGELNGVIHAAGLIGRESLTPFAELDRARCETQFRPKVDGLRVLARLVADRPLDFCLVTSSLASQLGGFGFAAYAAANAFMDAFVKERNRTSDTAWIAVNWDGWQEDEAAAELGGTHALAMTPQEGVEAFARIMTRPELENVLVSTGDLRHRLEQWTYIRQQADERQDGAEATSGQHARPDVSSSFRAPETDAEIAVAGIWQELLGIDSIGADDDFFELGGDSLLATRIVARLREAFQVEVPLRELFEESTVTALAARVEDILIEQIEGLSDEEAEQQMRPAAPTAGVEHD